MDVADRAQDDAVLRPPAAPRPGRRRSWALLALAVVALVCAALLPLAPVSMSVPTVSWPQQPGRPASTMLELTNETPLALDVRFSCAAVRAAQAVPDGVLLATLVPGQPVDPPDGLLVTATGGRLEVSDRGRVLLAEPVRAGDCGYRVTGSVGEIQVERDGAAVGGWRAAASEKVLPDVDVLATGLRSLGSVDDLRVRLTLDDQFDTTPAWPKKLLIALLLLTAAGSLAALWRDDRRRPARDRARRPGRRVDPLTVLLDVGVVAVLLVWLFIAPLTDDDGYYAAMARNSVGEGFVGNYYQLLNQSFTPFTWFYRVLGWQAQLGTSPVLLRLPALVSGLVTWWLLRRYLAQPGALPAAVAGRPWPRRGAVLLLAATFLAWWLPYGMGVRPEAIAGVLAMGTLYGVSSGLRRRRLLPVGLGVGAAALAVVCHPAGFVALGPLLVSLPRLTRLVRAGADRGTALARTALLLAPAAFASAASFADGSLNDFLRGQQIFLSYQDQNTWYDEFQRYGFLLSPNPMGNYAKRTAVLLGIAALVWFLALAVAARARGVRVPAPLLLAGSSLGAGFLLLWITPSKWTHHFGVLSGLGPAFLALFLASAAVLVREITGRRGPRLVTGLLVLGTCVVTAALAMHGPNQWPYSWLPGVPHAEVVPYVGPVSLDSAPLWALLAAVVCGGVVLLRRRRRRADRTDGAAQDGAAQDGHGGTARTPVWLVATPVLVLLFLATSLGYLVGGFGLATVRTLHGWSPWADAVTDPLAHHCGAAGDLTVLDPSRGRPLAAAGPAPQPDPGSDFVAGAGWPAADPPPAGSPPAWGSLPAPDQGDRAGTLTTPWYALPAPGPDDRLALLAAGRLDDGNTLQVEFAAGSPAAPRVVRTQVFADAVDQPAWRTFVLDILGARSAGADLVRVVAADHSGGPGGWLAVTAPSLVRPVLLTDYVPPDAPVALAWQNAFYFPCQRQPTVRHGVTEAPRYGVVWRDPSGWGLLDATWQLWRGGLFAPVRRASSVTELGTAFASDPAVRNLEVFRFDLPYRSGGYDLTPHRVTRAGWSGPPAG